MHSRQHKSAGSNRVAKWLAAVTIVASLGMLTEASLLLRQQDLSQQLILAVSKHDLTKCEALLNQGANPNCEGNFAIGDTNRYSRSTWYGFLRQLLMPHNNETREPLLAVAIEESDYWGCEAAGDRGCNSDIIELLLQRGASPNSTVRKYQGKDNWHLVNFAADHRSIANIIPMLLKYGANPNSRCPDGTPLLVQHWLLDVPIDGLRVPLDIDANTKGYTLLYYVAGERFPARVKQVLERGANPNIKTVNGESPLTAARGDAVTTALLKRYGAH